MKQWFIKHKKTIGRVSILTAILATFTLIVYFTLNAFGLTSIAGLQALVASAGPYSILVFIAVQVVVTTLLCFVPMIAATMAVVANVMFNTGTPEGVFKTFIILLIGTVIASQMLFLIGRFGSVKLAEKIIGKEEIEKAQRLLKTKAKVFLPVMYMLTFFPDDALAFAAGMIKMNFWRHLIYVLVFRGLGIFVIAAFGTELIDYSAFTLSDWFTFISAGAFWVLLLLYLGNKLSVRLEQRETTQIKDSDVSNDNK